MNTCRDCNALTSGHCPQHPMVVSYPISTPTHSPRDMDCPACLGTGCGYEQGSKCYRCTHSPTETVSDCCPNHSQTACGVVKVPCCDNCPNFDSWFRRSPEKNKKMFEKPFEEKYESMKFCFQANIVAELKNTPKRKKFGSSVAEIVAMLKRGEIKVIELPMFLSVPTIILKEQDL